MMPKNMIICGIKEYEYASKLLKLRNEIMPIFLSLAIRPQKYRCEDYSKYNRTNKIN